MQPRVAECYNQAYKRHHATLYVCAHCGRTVCDSCAFPHQDGGDDAYDCEDCYESNCLKIVAGD